ncbi:MAG TPA: GMC family oxidoreductase [Anaerolineaceae bacterium]|nr:GMC family oxidoreductase [Anaerolineaceae bacterium]
MKKQTRKGRRGFSLFAWAAAIGGAVAFLRILRRNSNRPQDRLVTAVPGPHFHTVVIGSGFGGSMAGLTVARAIQARGKGERLLMLERGTWWTTPVNTVEDKNGAVAGFLRQKGQPVQFWNSIDHFVGLFDLVLRCVRRPGNENGLYTQTVFGRGGPLGLSENDGVSIVGGNGVGGGSLVYSNVTIAPPDFVLDDPVWPVHWNGRRQEWFDLARDAIGSGVLYAWEKRAGSLQGAALQGLRTGTGLSNLATRSPRLDPHWPSDPAGRQIKRIDLKPPLSPDAPDPEHAVWLDRARVFQTAMSQITADFGTLDSAINDLPDGPEAFNSGDAPTNYCERQGRCVLGCLPNARQTLSKQFMAAVHGTPALFTRPAQPPLLPCMSLEPLSEVDQIRARPGGGYEVHYIQRDELHPQRVTRKMVTADQVIVAAGCASTNEILLRSKMAGGLPFLSEKLGYGFSTNGDSLQFLSQTRERTYLTRGPMMTSYGLFHTQASGEDADPLRFHAIEDNGLPKVLATLVGVGQPIARALARGRAQVPEFFLAQATALFAAKKAVPRSAKTLLPTMTKRQTTFESEDEALANMLCVATMGRDQANGQFSLGDPAAGDTPLRLRRADGKEFYQDPIYHEIRQTLNRFAEVLTGQKGAAFQNPFFDLGRGGTLLAPVPLTHPLGGCRMASSAEQGVVDEYGRVFDASQKGDSPYYKGLYVVDAAIIPTSLGVNPTLTIAALALRAGDQIVRDAFTG